MSRSIDKYRFWCETEQKYKYVWDEASPTVCPVDAAHTIDLNSLSIVDGVRQNATSVINLPKTGFDELRVAERSLVIELKSIYGKSTLRDVYVEEGTATITNNLGDSEFTLKVNDGNDVAWLQSAERGRYVAGLQGEVGIATRMVDPLVGNQTLRIGLFDTSNGFYYKYTSNNMYACILRDAIETEIARETWNIDRFDGTGPSGVTLNPFDGNIYNIRFTWYGYGDIEFRLTTVSADLIQSSYLGHVYNPFAQTSVKNPNLPLSVRLDSNGTTATTTAKVAGRQYSLLGKYTPIFRLNAAYRLSFNVNSLTFIPIMSIRRKIGYLGNSIKAIEADLISGGQMVIQFRTGTTLTGASFTTPNDTDPNDTAVEYDTSATAVTGGIPIWTGLISGESRANVSSSLQVSHDLTNYETMTICARLVANIAGGALISTTLRWTEEW